MKTKTLIIKQIELAEAAVKAHQKVERLKTELEEAKAQLSNDNYALANSVEKTSGALPETLCLLVDGIMYLIRLNVEKWESHQFIKVDYSDRPIEEVE